MPNYVSARREYGPSKWQPLAKAIGQVGVNLGSAYIMDKMMDDWLPEWETTVHEETGTAPGGTTTPIEGKILETPKAQNALRGPRPQTVPGPEMPLSSVPTAPTPMEQYQQALAPAQEIAQQPVDQPFQTNALRSEEERGARLKEEIERSVPPPLAKKLFRSAAAFAMMGGPEMGMKAIQMGLGVMARNQKLNVSKAQALATAEHRAAKIAQGERGLTAGKEKERRTVAIGIAKTRAKSGYPVSTEEAYRLGDEFMEGGGGSVAYPKPKGLDLRQIKSFEQFAKMESARDASQTIGDITSKWQQVKTTALGGKGGGGMRLSAKVPPKIDKEVGETVSNLDLVADLHRLRKVIEDTGSKGVGPVQGIVSEWLRRHGYVVPGFTMAKFLQTGTIQIPPKIRQLTGTSRVAEKIYDELGKVLHNPRQNWSAFQGVIRGIASQSASNLVTKLSPYDMDLSRWTRRAPAIVDNLNYLREIDPFVDQRLGGVMPGTPRMGEESQAPVQEQRPAAEMDTDELKRALLEGL